LKLSYELLIVVKAYHRTIHGSLVVVAKCIVETFHVSNENLAFPLLSSFELIIVMV